MSAANDVVQYPRHDIFLSHSGTQKDFAIALHDALQNFSYSTFLDVEDHSLPPGLDFPARIFHACHTCRLALLVISEEFVSTKWPMLELCAFVAAASHEHPQPQYIVPLFFKLAPSDLKQHPNKDKWQAAWQQLAEKDPSRIKFSEWRRAFQILGSRNGIQIQPSEDQPAYIDRICLKVRNLLPPSIRHDFSGFPGIHRMSQAVLAKIKQLNGAVKVMGMYGLPGSGKSTICSYLCDNQFTHFRGKTLHLELPIDPTAEDLLEKSKKLLTHLTDFNRKLELSKVTDLLQVYHLLKHTDFLKSTVFLVVDNISCDKSVNAVADILRLGLAAGSVVLLVARTLDILEPLLHHQNRHCLVGYGRMSVPSLTDEEALGVLLQFVEYDKNLPHTAVMKEVLSLSSNGPGQHLPLVLKIMRLQLIRQDFEKWSREMDQFDWTRMWQYKEKALEDLVLKSFNDLSDRLQHLFLDLALFILPLSYVDGESNYNHTNTACVYLGLMHGGSPEDIQFELNDQLQRHCFLTIVLREAGTTAATARDSIITMDNVYLEFATSIKEAASKYYWSSGHRWSRAKRTQAIEVQSANTKLRTVVLELDERQETFGFSHHFSGVKAMVLRNCKSLKCLGGLENLNSLASLQIHNCPGLKWMESPAILKWMESPAPPMLQRIDWVDSENVRKHWKYQRHAGQRMLLDCPPEYVILAIGRPCRPIEIAISLVLLQIQLRPQENTRSIRHLLTTHFPKLELFGDGKPSYRHPQIGWLDHRHHHLEEDHPRSDQLGRLGCPELQDVYGCFTSTIAGLLVGLSWAKALVLNSFSDLLKKLS